MPLAALSAGEAGRHLAGLGELLHACVHDGASVGFVLPYTQADAEAFWAEKVFPAVQAGTRTLLAAHIDGRIAGTVQLDCDTPPNQPQRAEVRKLLVHPRHRRQGLGRALMLELEQRARMAQRRLLTLDTRTGDHAEPLYAALGYQRAGVIPGFCLDVARQRYDATTIMYKLL
ncbi:GNAT family N-acetyltransferase [Bordetella petrii]|nr:GNAT family N-acetyltransferase [Bordetella petrii]MCD0505483.1 GNAT family N-acetyltransferase [Bordetella petrii]